MQCECGELARQLTIQSSRLFSQISRADVLNYALQNDESSSVACLQKQTDLLTRWTIHSVLSAKDTKEQIALYRKLARVCTKLIELGNYESCSGVVGGLMDFSIQSLPGLREVR